MRASLLILWTVLQVAPSWLLLHRSPQHEGALRRIGIHLGLLAERWGPAAIKVAQVAASRRDLFPRSLLQPLERIQDQLKSPSKSALRRNLIEVYGPPGEWPFRIVSWQPIAAGSIAVVLHAEAADGSPLAIKLVRKGVPRQVQADLLCLTWLARRLQHYPRFSHLPLISTLDEISNSVEQQCDMLREAEAYERIVPSLGPGIASPRPYGELSRPSALAMEFRGAEYKLSDPRVPPDVYRENCRSLLHAIYRMIFVNGFVHCDLHPGNVATDGSGGIILYDLGLSAELTPRDRDILTGLFEAIDSANPIRLAGQIIAAASMVPESLDIVKLQSGAHMIVARWSGKSAGDFLVAGLANDLFDLQHRHGIRSRPTFVAAIWALATFEGLVRDRYPDLDFQLEARPFLKSALIARLRPRVWADTWRVTSSMAWA